MENHNLIINSPVPEKKIMRYEEPSNGKHLDIWLSFLNIFSFGK